MEMSLVARVGGNLCSIFFLHLTAIDVIRYLHFDWTKSEVQMFIRLSHCSHRYHIDALDEDIIDRLAVT